MPEYYDDERRKKKRERKGEGPISRYKRKMYGRYRRRSRSQTPKLAKKRDDARFDRFGDDTESRRPISSQFSRKTTIGSYF